MEGHKAAINNCMQYYWNNSSQRMVIAVEVNKLQNNKFSNKAPCGSIFVAVND